MCDILVATPEVTTSRKMIFAKNSDRDPNEAQIIEHHPKKEPEKITTKLTYEKFPRLGERNEIIISRPWWIWGAEMGANEHGLVIGNTATFTKEKYSEKGLLGMDMLRLVLERKNTVRDALGFMAAMIENYGQGGSGSYDHKFLYHNSFIIADSKEAWVLESAGENWTADKITGVYSTSNTLTVEGKGRISSNKLISKAMDEGWIDDPEDFNFKEDYVSSGMYQRLANGNERREFTFNKLREKKGDIDIEYMMDLLRSHHKEPYEPKKGSNRDICMHYGFLSRKSHTASSQISEIGKENQVHWFTGTSNPCLSIFKPLNFSDSLPNLGCAPTNKYDPNNYWWKFESFHRRFQTNYRRYIGPFRREWDKLQRRIIKKEKEGMEDITEWGFSKEDLLRKRWEKKIETGKFGLLHGLAWKKANKKANLSL